MVLTLFTQTLSTYTDKAWYILLIVPAFGVFKAGSAWFGKLSAFGREKRGARGRGARRWAQEGTQAEAENHEVAMSRRRRSLCVWSSAEPRPGPCVVAPMRAFESAAPNKLSGRRFAHQAPVPQLLDSPGSVFDFKRGRALPAKIRSICLLGLPTSQDSCRAALTRRRADNRGWSPYLSTTGMGWAS